MSEDQLVAGLREKAREHVSLACMFYSPEYINGCIRDSMARVDNSSVNRQRLIIHAVGSLLGRDYAYLKHLENYEGTLKVFILFLGEELASSFGGKRADYITEIGSYSNFFSVNGFSFEIVAQ